MSRLMRSLLPVIGAVAWRKRSQITDWYRNRKASDDPKQPPATPTEAPPTH